MEKKNSITLKYLPEELSLEKKSHGICGITGCKNLAIKEIPLRNEDLSWMWVFVCWFHLQKARRCKFCVDYESTKTECRHPAPYQTMRRVKGPKWILMGPEESCGQWSPKDAIPIKLIRDIK